VSSAFITGLAPWSNPCGKSFKAEVPCLSLRGPHWLPSPSWKIFHSVESVAIYQPKTTWKCKSKWALQYSWPCLRVPRLYFCYDM